MLDTSIYVNHPVTKELSSSEIPSYFSSLMIGDVGNVSECILVIAAYCGYVSYEEICSLFPQLHAVSLRKRFSELRNKGYLVTENLPHRDGFSDNYYRISKKGFMKAQGIFDHMLPQWNKYPRKPLEGTSYLSHIYSVGYNFIQMLMLGIPIEWRREISDAFSAEVSWRNYRGVSGSLWSDAVCSVYPDNPDRYRLIYFEQDMLTENNRILMDKLESYYHLGLMNYLADFIVLSFRKTGVALFANRHVASLSPFSEGKCKELLHIMRLTKEHDAFSLLEYVDITDNFKRYIIDFLLKVGAIKVRDTEDGPEYTRTKVVADLHFIEEFYRTLVNHTNPYALEELNKVHCHMTNLRLFYAVRSILSTKGVIPDYIRPLLKGFQVLYVPTTLVSEHIPYGMLSLFPDKKAALTKCLGQYFDELNYVSELSNDIGLSNGISIKLRNLFSYTYLDEGQPYIGHVCVEFPSMDLGAWLRVYMFLTFYEGEEPLNVICVFDSKEQSTEFFSTFKFASSTYISLNGSGVFCLYIDQIYNEKPLFIDADILNHEKILNISTSVVE